MLRDCVYYPVEITFEDYGGKSLFFYQNDYGEHLFVQLSAFLLRDGFDLVADTLLSMPTWALLDYDVLGNSVVDGYGLPGGSADFPDSMPLSKVVISRPARIQATIFCKPHSTQKLEEQEISIEADDLDTLLDNSHFDVDGFYERIKDCFILKRDPRRNVSNLLEQAEFAVDLRSHIRSIVASNPGSFTPSFLDVLDAGVPLTDEVEF